MNEKLNLFLSQELNNLKEQGLEFKIRILETMQAPSAIIDGKRVINLASNNYLGLISSELIKEEAKKAIDEFGVGSGAVKTIIGNLSLHEKLEKTLADFKGSQAVLLFQSGFVANLGVIPAIVKEGDLIFSDALNHASIIDGCRLSKALIIPYEHRNMSSLKALLAEHKNSDKRKLIVSDGVFSMDGDIAPLPDIVELAKRYDAITMVDDAHGEGVLGKNGRGIVNHFHLENEVDIEIGTLSKAFGVIGGYVAGSKILIDYLKQKARPILFSTTITPADTAAIIKAVDILKNDDLLVKKLWENAKYFKEKMKEAGFDTWKSETPITPIIIGDAQKASLFSKKLFEEGVFAQNLGFPTVPKGLARIRVMISAIHSKEQLDFAIEKFVKVKKEIL